jgi:uncharacterized protein (DUF1499 family)
MKIVVNLLIILLILGVGLSSGAVLLNKVPILDPPGWKTRLIVYLSRNSAETDPRSPLPELHPDLYSVSVEQLFDLVREAAIELDWHIKSIDHTQMSMHVVVTTALLGFKDDMTIRVMAKAGDKSSLYASSQSRIGRADYGANLGHILKLKRTIHDKALRL